MTCLLIVLVPAFVVVLGYHWVSQSIHFYLIGSLNIRGKLEKPRENFC